MELRGSQTERNMKAAFQGESMARNKYSFYEEQAKAEGHEEVAQLFARMARNETMHAKMWYKKINGGMQDSFENLKEAAKGEGDEWQSMYPKFAKIAREEGFEEIAAMFDQVAQIERDHEMSFLKAFAALKRKSTQAEAVEAEPEVAEPKQEKHVHRCMFCGAVYEHRPDVCPVCQAIGSFERGTAYL